MRVFVTGASGFIGHRLAERLLADGHEVVALTRRSGAALPAGVHAVVGDLLAPESYGRAGEGCERLYHLAALITFDPRRRGELMRQNGDGTALILDAARKWGVAKTVIVSSACTLGLSTTPDAVLDETATASPFLARANPYLASKLRAEDEAMRRAREMEVVMVNPTTVYGRGDRTLNSGTLVAQVARSPVVPVPPGGGNVVDVDDVARGILAAAEQGRSGRRYVLGGENLSFAANIETITRVVGRRPVMVPLPAWTRCAAVAAARVASAMPGGRFLTPQIVADLYAFKYYSTARAAAELNWRPRVPFEESVRQAWEFYRKEGLI